MPTEDSMTTQDLAGAERDQAASGSRPVDWKTKYDGAIGKVSQLQTELSEARVGFQDERKKWDAERGQFQAQMKELQIAMEQAQRQTSELTGARDNLTAELAKKAQEAESLAAARARQSALLKYPGLINESILKLVEASTLPAEDLEQVLGGMAQGQQTMIRAAFQEAQTGATQSVSPTTTQTATKDMAEQLLREALEARSKGDMAGYKAKQRAYTTWLDQTGQSTFAQPATLVRSLT